MCTIEVRLDDMTKNKYEIDEQIEKRGISLEDELNHLKNWAIKVKETDCDRTLFRNVYSRHRNKPP